MTLQLVKYYGTLRFYNWFMLWCRNFMRWLRFHFKRMLIKGLGQETFPFIMLYVINNSYQTENP